MPNCSSKPSTVRPALRVHDAGVVHEPVQRVVRRPERMGEGAHRREIGEVERRHLDGAPDPLGAERVRGGGARVGASAGEHHVGPLPGQLRHGRQADAGVAAGHDVGATGEVELEKVGWAHDR